MSDSIPICHMQKLVGVRFSYCSGLRCWSWGGGRGDTSLAQVQALFPELKLRWSDVPVNHLIPGFCTLSGEFVSVFFFLNLHLIP